MAAALLLLAAGAGSADEGTALGLSAGITTTSGDVYRAGLSPTVAGSVNGDLAVAGGEVRIGGDIAGDLLAAGARLHVAGDIRDDARVAGGTISIDSRIGDHLMVAANTIELRPGSEIVGDLRASGGRVVLEGRVNGPAEITADRVQIQGHLGADVRIAAERVEVGPRARIDGTLRYRADEPATVADGARIRGEQLFERNVARQAAEPEATDTGEQGTDMPGIWGIGPLVLWVAAALVAAAVLNGLFPGFVRASERTAVERPWQSLGVGLLTLAAVPVIVLLLLALVVTLPLGLTVMALAPVAVLVGYLLFAFVATERVTRLVGADPSHTSRRLLWVAGILLVLALVQGLPVVGGAALAAAVVFGTGSGLITLTNIRRGSSCHVKAK